MSIVKTSSSHLSAAQVTSSMPCFPSTALPSSSTSPGQPPTQQHASAPLSPASSSEGHISPGLEPGPSLLTSPLPFPLPLTSQIPSDHRLSSINTLRLKAKEQMEIFKESCFNR